LLARIGDEAEESTIFNTTFELCQSKLRCLRYWLVVEKKEASS